jgi:hypothetical protein
VNRFTSPALSDWQTRSSNWSLAYGGTDSAAIVTDNQAHPGSMTHLIYKYSTSRNMEIRFSFKMSATGGANAGFQFRSRCQNASGNLANNCGGSPWILCGPQMDLGQSYAGDIYNGCSGAYVNSGTASNPPNVVNNNPTCKTGLNITVWNNYRFRIFNDTAWTYRNDVLCSKYKMTASTDVAASTAGMISLQYETISRAEWRGIEIKNLSQPVTLVQSGARGFNIPSLEGGRMSLVYTVAESGNYSLEVADVRGSVVRSARGVGPVAGKILPLDRSGAFIVKIRTPNGVSSGKVVVF